MKQNNANSQNQRMKSIEIFVLRIVTPFKIQNLLQIVITRLASNIKPKTERQQLIFLIMMGVPPFQLLILMEHNY